MKASWVLAGSGGLLKSTFLLGKDLHRLCIELLEPQRAVALISRLSRRCVVVDNPGAAIGVEE